MDIRTKLALAFVLVSLVSMFVLGTFAYEVSSQLLKDITERQLDALAESKKQDLENVVESWRSQVRLIRSRTQLRLQLKAYQESGRDESLAEMLVIVNDAQTSTEHVERIVLFDREGRKLVVAGTAERDANAAPDLEGDEVNFGGFFLGEDGAAEVVFNAPVRLNAEAIGSIEVVFDVNAVENVAANQQGHGETGETMVIGNATDGRIVLLHAPRHTDEILSWPDPPEYVTAALSGQERLFTKNVRDYRGRAVWAATRYLPDVGWGLVEKVDAEEETSGVRELRSDLIDLGLALGAFAVVGGTLLGLYLARPIRELEQVLRRLAKGESSLRANADPDDEIGLLADALNDYLDRVNDEEGRDRQ